MDYFIYQKNRNTIGCLFMKKDGTKILNSRVTKHTFNKLTKKEVEDVWPWINNDGEHIFLYKGDECPEWAINYVNTILENTLKIELPDILRTSEDKLLQIDEDKRLFATVLILIQAVSFFNENPELVEDIPALKVYSELTQKDFYSMEDLIIDIEDIYQLV